MSGSQAVTLYMTFPDMDNARQIAAALVEERLIACANILPAMVSVFRWEGKVEEQEEVAMLAKTVAGRVAAIEAVLAERHPYAVPCLTVWPIADGHQPYLDWIGEETALA
ncbi:MAG: divalent-cation tolerance protein CutA [Azospirillaceae bacterium]